MSHGRDCKKNNQHLLFIYKDIKAGTTDKYTSQSIIPIITLTNYSIG